MSNYTEGELLYDKEHKEFFAFNKKRDGFMVNNRPETIRKPTQEEIDKYNEFIKKDDQ